MSNQDKNTDQCNEKEYDISVIIPVYNVRPYIEECVESLVNQTIQGIQFIFIDNGCKDDTMTVVEKYAKKNGSIEIVKIEDNVGLPAARNIGLSHAKGKYISFVDSDDIVDRTMFEKMFEVAESKKAEVVVCNIATFETTLESSADHHPEHWYLETEYAYPITGHPEQWMEQAAWGKLILRDFAESVSYKFTDGSLCCEEVPGTTRLFLGAQRICSVNQTLYFYRDRPDSLSKKMNLKYVDDFVWAMKQQDRILESYKFSDELNIYYIFMMRILLSNHILRHLDRKMTEKGIIKIKEAFDLFKENETVKFLSKNEFAKNIYGNIEKNNSRFFRKRKGV